MNASKRTLATKLVTERMISQIIDLYDAAR